MTIEKSNRIDIEGKNQVKELALQMRDILPCVDPDLDTIILTYWNQNEPKSESISPEWLLWTNTISPVDRSRITAMFSILRQAGFLTLGEMRSLSSAELLEVPRLGQKIWDFATIALDIE